MEEIAFHYQTDFGLKQEKEYTEWIIELCKSHTAEAGTINFIFMPDEDMLKMNRDYLGHDYYTDIITFEYSEMSGLSGDVFISVDRVRENAAQEGEEMMEEMRRVMAHGVLHLIGFTDKTHKETEEMRYMEDKALKLFHVKHKA